MDSSKTWIERKGVGARGIQLSTLDDIFRFARWCVAAGLAPRGLERPEAAALVIQAGLEVGITPMLALRWAMVVNNRPCWWGDLPLALARRGGHWDEAAFDEHFEGKPYEDDFRAICTVRRLPGKPKSYTFTVAQAKKAKLWGKSGPWSEYPDRMLQFRARGFLLRDTFSDALGGLDIAEEQYGMAPPANLVGDAEAVPIPSDLDGLAASLREEPKPEPAEEPKSAVKRRRRELEKQAVADVGDEVGGDEGLDEREPGDDGEDLI